MKERRTPGHAGTAEASGPYLDRAVERAQKRKLLEEALLRDAEHDPQDHERIRTLLARLDDWTEVQLHRSKVPCKATRFEREVALADLAPAMTPQAALTYAAWVMASERGWGRPAHRGASSEELLDEPLDAIEPSFEQLASSRSASTAGVGAPSSSAEALAAQTAQTAQTADDLETVEWAAAHRTLHPPIASNGQTAKSAGERPPTRVRRLVLGGDSAGRGAKGTRPGDKSPTTEAAPQGTGDDANRRSHILRQLLAPSDSSLDHGTSSPSLPASLPTPVAAQQVPPSELQRPDERAAAAPSPAAATSGRPGRPLDEQAREQMEYAFGTSFANVRIHESAQPQALGAVAFARGEDLHFQPGAYDPTSPAGLELLGHELAHVVQQRDGRVTKGKGGVNTDAALESEADELGSRAARGEPLTKAGTGTPPTWAEQKGAQDADTDPNANLRNQLLEAATTGRGADAALRTAAPEIAMTVLRQLRDTPVPGHSATALQLLVQAADVQVLEQLLGQGSSGQALSAAVEDRLAPHVGPEVTSAARLHTDESADLLAAAHHAHAVTIGDRIYFASGQFAPGTPAGDELLVHELTHVGQGQRGELTGAAAKGVNSGEALTPTEAQADLRARFAVIKLYGPTAAPPSVSQPTAQPVTEGERGVKLAEQQARLLIASRDDIPNTPLPSLPPLTPATTTATSQGPSQAMQAAASVITHAASALRDATASPAAKAPAKASAGSAPSGNAYADTFDAPPSKQATELWATAGSRATTQATTEHARFEATLPTLLNGTAAPVTRAAGPTTPTPAPAPARSAASAVPPATAAPAIPPPTTAPPTVVTVPASTTATAETFEQLPAGLETEPTVGVALVADLAGAADPVLAQLNQHQGANQAVTAFEGCKEQILAGRGPAVIQPGVLDEKLVVPPLDKSTAMPELPVIPEMLQFKQLNLPADVQASFDSIARPKMEAKLDQAKTKVLDAEQKRDLDRNTAVTNAKTKAQQAHVDANQKQQAKVAESRVQIVNHQAATLLQHDAEFKKLDAQADAQKKATVGKIEARVSGDQSKIQSDFGTAQQQAQAKKLEVEAEIVRLKADGQAQYAAEEAKAPPRPEGEEPADPVQMKFGDRLKKAWNWVEDNVVDPVVDFAKDAWNAFKEFAKHLADFFVNLVKSIGDAIDKALKFAAEAITTIIDKVKELACNIIDAVRDFLCEALRAFGEFLKSAISLLIGSVFPQLAAALNQLIDGVISLATKAINAIADSLKAAVTAVANLIKTVVNKAITIFRSAVQAATASISALLRGDWSEFALIALEAVLKILGIDPEDFYAFVGRAKDTILKILSNPIAFVKNLIGAIKLGFQQFGNNFLTHFKNGVLEWLFGTFAEAGFQMPSSFDVAGVFTLVAQVLGINMPGLSSQVAGLVGAEDPEQVQFIEENLEPLLANGFAGLWKELQQDLSTLWEDVVGGAQQWIMQQVVLQAALKVATMWNPAGALVQLIRTAWAIYLWVKENAQRIKRLLTSIVSSIADIAAGNIAGAANNIEAALATLVPITISLFASLVGVTGIAGKLKALILKLRAKVDKAIDKLLKRIKAKYKPKNKDVGIRVPFQVRGKTHTQYIDKGEPMVASTPSAVKAKLEEWRPHLRECPPEVSKQAGSLIGKAIAIERKVDTLVTQAQANAAQGSALAAKQRELADALKETWEYMLTLPIVATGTMNGEHHTLTADLDKNELRLASIETDAIEKIDAAIAKVNKMDVPAATLAKAQSALKKIVAKLKSLKTTVGKANQKIDNEGEIPLISSKTSMAKAANDIMGLLSEYGSTFGVKDVDIDLPQFNTDEDYRLLAETVGKDRLTRAFEEWNKDIDKSSLSENGKKIWTNFQINKGAAEAPAIAHLEQAIKAPPIQTISALKTALASGAGSVKEGFHRTAGNQVVDQVKAAGKQVATLPATETEIDKTTYSYKNTGYGKIEMPGGDPTADVDLKEAVGKVGIVQFMKDMATKGQSGQMTYQQFQEAWKLQVNVNFLKEEFRKADPGKHEWIPSNMIAAVIERARSTNDLEVATAWIELHHTLRSDTAFLIYKPSFTESAGGSKINGKLVLSGHAGAIYVDGKKHDASGAPKPVASMIGQPGWHDTLRNIFSNNTSMKTVISEMHDHFKNTIWDGNANEVQGVHTVYYDSKNNPINWKSLPGVQAKNYKEVDESFKTIKQLMEAYD